MGWLSSVFFVAGPKMQETWRLLSAFNPERDKISRQDWVTACLQGTICPATLKMETDRYLGTGGRSPPCRALMGAATLQTYFGSLLGPSALKPLAAGIYLRLLRSGRYHRRVALAVFRGKPHSARPFRSLNQEAVSR